VTIEFHCPHCDKLLKTPDDKAGVRANCPGCGQTVTVPEPMAEAALADESFAESEHVPDVVDAGAATRSDTKPCPMCGAMIKKAATRCRFCGEALTGRLQSHAPGGRGPTRIDAGEVLSQTWRLYKKHIIFVIAGVMIWIGIPVGVQLVLGFVQQIVLIGFGGPVAPGAAPPMGAVVASLGVSLVSIVINIVAQNLLEAGGRRFLIRIGQGGDPEIADLFTGMPYVWRFFWGGLLYGIAVGFGLLLVLVPGIIIMLMFWPFFYIIVDRNVGVIESLQQAREITAENYMAVFLLALAGIGINLLGMLAICFGLIFTVPFTFLMFGVAYCSMTGQLATAQE
jgi:DNA-directed RNA polymerase subunit M/transcription elongation factor TFIIS